LSFPKTGSTVLENVFLTFSSPVGSFGWPGGSRRQSSVMRQSFPVALLFVFFVVKDIFLRPAKHEGMGCGATSAIH
jgi:hypothetical protein